jgi:dUTP pyrophosphatase
MPNSTQTVQSEDDENVGYVFVMDPDLRFTKVREVKSPCRGTPGSAGIDLFVPDYLEEYDVKGGVIFDKDGLSFRVLPHKSVLIPSGLHFEIPVGYALIAYNKSGVAVKKHFDIGASVCDSDYQGEVHISLTNTSDDVQTITLGDKIVQFLLVPVDHRQVEEVYSLDELYKYKDSERGAGGFGSTGTT